MVVFVRISVMSPFPVTGSGLLGILRLTYPEAFPDDVGLFSVIVVGALFGAGIQPGLRLAGYLAQLWLLKRMKSIKKKQRAKLVKKLTKTYFADSPQGNDQTGR
jgi:hypothetical protein